MNERIEEIRINLAECEKYGGFVEGYISTEDWSCLLERIDTLTKELHTQSDGLKRAIDKELELQHRIGELGRENERLRDGIQEMHINNGGFP